MRKPMSWFIAGALFMGLLGSVTGRADILGSLGKLRPNTVQVPGVSSAGGDVLNQALNNSGSINRALNSAAGSLAVRDGATKIVPVLSIGSGLAVGLAQVAGPARYVEETQAVAEIQTTVLTRSIRARVLVPVNTRNITGSISRIGQVGVAALVDLRL